MTDLTAGHLRMVKEYLIARRDGQWLELDAKNAAVHKALNALQQTAQELGRVQRELLLREEKTR